MTESLINEFWRRKYGLRIQAYTDGPSTQAFAESLGERARGALGVTQVHHTASYSDDDFFGSIQDFLSR